MANPYGVIFDGEKAYVGSPHGKPISLSAGVKDRVLDLVRLNGVWYEGDGGDVSVNAHLFGGKSAYRGSWDKAFGKTVKGYPPEFLSGLFSNVEVNGQVKAFLSPEMTILESLVKHQDGIKYFEDRKYTAADVTEFLRVVSDRKYDFLEMAKERATKRNLEQFFAAGESRMFPANWDKYLYPAGKTMRKFEDARNQFLLEQKSGVYVVGAGHLLELKRLDKSLKLTGGARVGD